MRSDTQQKLDRNLKLLLGENSLLIKTYKYEEVLDMLLLARKRTDNSIEFDGNMEPVCESKLKGAYFHYQTFASPNQIIRTRISW